MPIRGDVVTRRFGTVAGTDAVGFAVLVLTVVAVWAFGGRAFGVEQWTVNRVLLTLLTLVAVFSAASAAKAASGRLRVAWITLGVGRLGWAIGELIWDHSEFVRHRLTFPSVADAAFLLWTASACVGLMLYPRGRGIQTRVVQLLDGAIVASALFIVSWLTILGDLFAEDSSGTETFALALVYPTSDIAILAAAAIVLIRAGTALRPSLALLVAGVSCIALADFGFAYLIASGRYGLGSATDFGWIAGLLLMIAAARFSRAENGAGEGHLSRPSEQGWASICLPYAPVLLAGAAAALAPERFAQAGPVQFVGVLLIAAVLVRQFVSVSEHRRLLALVSQQALHDPLTGAGNRALFGLRLERALAHRPAGTDCVGVILLDLNDFKLVNDTLGHAGGDQLLIEVAARLIGCVGDNGTVARLGGDEFAVHVEDIPAGVEAVARELVRVLDQPFVIQGHEVLIDASIGVALAGRTDSGLSAEVLLRRADLAMYEGKQSRARSPQLFEPASTDLNGDETQTGRLELLANHRANVLLVQELRRAIDGHQMALAYQPKYDLTTMKIVGVEALLRWPHPSRGVIAPSRFLPLVRRHGLIRQVTEFVVDTAVRDAGVWRREWLDVPVSINMFVPLLADPTVIDMVLCPMIRGGITAGSLAVETTEDLLLDNFSTAGRIMNTLRDNGIKVAIDDFGKGHVALSYLRDLPIDEVKLDSSLIAPILKDSRAAALLQAAVGMIHGLGLTAVAKCVEDRDTVERLRDYGCDIGQGYFFSPPLDLQNLLGLPAGYSPHQWE